MQLICHLQWIAFAIKSASRHETFQENEDFLEIHYELSRFINFCVCLLICGKQKVAWLSLRRQVSRFLLKRITNISQFSESRQKKMRIHYCRANIGNRFVMISHIMISHVVPKCRHLLSSIIYWCITVNLLYMLFWPRNFSICNSIWISSFHITVFMCKSKLDGKPRHMGLLVGGQLHVSTLHWCMG